MISGSAPKASKNAFSSGDKSYSFPFAISSSISFFNLIISSMIFSISAISVLSLYISTILLNLVENFSCNVKFIFPISPIVVLIALDNTSAATFLSFIALNLLNIESLNNSKLLPRVNSPKFNNSSSCIASSNNLPTVLLISDTSNLPVLVIFEINDLTEIINKHLSFTRLLTTPLHNV